MEIKEFVKHFADQFDDTDASVFTPETIFRDIDEWSSLTGLSVMNMIGKKCGVKINAGELRNVLTIQQLFDLVQSKK